MTGAFDKLINSIIAVVEQRMAKNKAAPGSVFKYGTWQGSETADSNLSLVLLTGNTANTRFVPKLSSVTGLSVGDTVLLVRDKGTALTILGRVVGDTTLA